MDHKKELELIKKIQGGSPDYFSEILHKYSSLLYTISENYYIMGSDPSDTYQEAMIGLYRACVDYKEEKGMSFKNFAVFCIKRNLYSAIRAGRRKKYHHINTPLRLEMDFSEGNKENPLDNYIGSEKMEPLGLLLAKEDVNELQNFLLEKLSLLEKKILALRLKGCSYDTIAARLSCDKKTIDNALCRARKKIKILMTA